MKGCAPTLKLKPSGNAGVAQPLYDEGGKGCRQTAGHGQCFAHQWITPRVAAERVAAGGLSHPPLPPPSGLLAGGLRCPGRGRVRLARRGWLRKGVCVCVCGCVCVCVRLQGAGLGPPEARRAAPSEACPCELRARRSGQVFFRPALRWSAEVPLDPGWAQQKQRACTK